MPTPPSVSATPILDFELPLPSADDRRVTGRIALPFLLFVTFLCWIDNLAFLMVPVGILLIRFLSTLIHELGHVVAGLIAGLNFDGVVVGPVAIRRHHDGWHLRFRPRVAGGLTYMSPKEIRRIRHREIVGVAGGPILSLICGLVSLLGGEMARARYNSPWPAFFEFFGAFSLWVGTIALLPHYAGPHAGDGILLRVLLGRLPGTRQLIAARALSVLENKNRDCPGLHPRWVKLAYGDGTLLSPYHLSWGKFSTAPDSALAATFLEECLAKSGFLDPTERDALVAEAVIFCAWQRRDLAAAQKWLSRIRNPHQLPKLIGSTLNAAMASTAGDLKMALQSCDLALDLIERQCTGPGAEVLARSWRDWKLEIENRAAIALETVEANS